MFFETLVNSHLVVFFILHQSLHLFNKLTSYLPFHHPNLFMSTAHRAIIVLLVIVLSVPQTGLTQDSLSVSKRFISLIPINFSQRSLLFSKDSLSRFNLDSVAKQKLVESVALPDTSGFSTWLASLKKTSIPFSSKPFLRIGSGYINYNWNYRSGIDTPIIEKNISQHLVSGSFNTTIANSIPLRVTYFERRSNSNIFRDFRDVRVELNTQEFQRMQADRFRKYLTGLGDKLRDPLAKPAMDASLKKITQINSWLNYSAVKKKFIDSKELLISPDLLDTASVAKKDSILHEAKEFITLYEKMELQQEKYEKLYDSLSQIYISSEKKVRQFQQLMNGNLSNPSTIHALEEMVQKYGLKDKRFKKLSVAVTSIRTLAVGKTIPNFSSLTLKNTNVRGLNFEYNRNNLYLALAAGSVDFRVRDFVYNGQRRVPQFVYAARIGYGVKERNNIIFTYFEGKKQIYSGVSGNKSQNIKGVSIATQLVLAKNHKINAEFAQSAAPSLFNTNGSNEKPSLNFRDKNKQAYSLQIRSYIPTTKTKFEGQYQHSGINFQNFSNYRVNASANSWYAKAEQYFWKRNLHIVAALRKNDFSNPLILQRYNANTIFKNFTATFRKRNLPVFTVGYMPSSQYTVIDSMVYENRYQVLNASVTHQYKLGTAQASSALMYNRFYNDAQDTSFVYYNANNFFFNQSIRFSLYTANISVAHTENGTYTLDVWDAGLVFRILKQNALGFGVKINHINSDTIPRVGFYGNARMTIPKVGELNVWLEKNYLPGLRHQMIRNEFYNIGFIRYFN